MAFNVKVANGGFIWFLRSATWTSDPERAAVYATREMASAALARARQFMKPAMFRTAIIIEVALDAK